LSSAALDVGDADEEERDAHRGVKRDAAGSDPTALLPSKKQKLRLSSGSQGGSSSTFALRTSGGGLVSPASAFETDSLRSSSESNQTTPLATAAGSIAKTAIQGLRTNLAPGAPMSKLQSLIGKDNAKLKHKEDKLRELFVKDRNNFLLSDPHAHLMDVYKTPTAFTQEFETDEEIAIPKLLTKMRLPIRANESAILPTFQEFKKEFDSVTRNVFEDMDWKNVVVAGGAVLSSLLKLDEKDKAHFRDADVDLFLFGLSEEQAAQKVKDIFFQIQSRTNASCQIVRTRHAVTILGQYPNRHIQVILRLYKSPAEVLMGFDVDCCCVCYDGSAVWALPRAKRAITKRYNLVDMSRRSLTYETRLYKYAKRGFCVAVPGLQRQLVEPSIYDKRPWKVHGLAKLLIFENDVNTRAPRASRTSDPNAIWKPTNARHQRYQIYAKDEYTEDRINEFEAAENENTPDYSNIFLPWGPQWKLSKIMKHIEHRDKAFFFSGDSKRHMVLVGLDGVLEGKKPSWDKSEGTPNSLPKGAFVEGPIKFLTENPGRQLLSGSFHPVDDDSWFNDCYLNDPAKELVQHFVDASFGNRMDVLNTLVRKAGRQLDANVTDYFPQGRSALGYASLFNHGEVVRLLLDKGASFTAMDSSTGFQPIHYAAMAGHTSLFEVLAQKGARVSASTRDQNWTPLHFAAYYHHMDLLKVILNEYTSSIDLNAPDVQNRTPLFVAAMAGHLDAVQALKEAGAKLDLKDISLVSPMEMAAKLGNRAVATYLISELKPQYPPVIQDIPMPAGAAQSSSLFISEAISHDLFHAHDTAGQTILHYAVRTGEVHLVKKLVQARIKSGVEVEARFFRGIKFDVPAVSSDSKHVDVDAENIFGQTPLYYAHQLLSSVALPAGAPAPIGDSSNLFGLPKHDHLNNWLVIRELLVAAGASYPHLLYHRDLPEVKDDNMTNLVTRQAQAAKDEFKRLEAYELELERLFLEDAKKEQEKQKVSDHRSKKRRAASPPPQISDDSADLPFKAAAAAIPKATSASFSVGTGSIAASAPTSAYSTKYVETLSKAAAEPIEPFRPPETSPVSLTSAPTFTSLGSSTAISLSAFGGGSALGSTSSNLSAFGGSALSASSMMIGATPVKQQPRVASGAAPVQTARSTQILKSDIAILLARVISLAKANLITVAEKAVLKTLALQRDRHMIAALRAFQTDSDEEEFNDTLKSISALRAATPAF
jgi:ankyrin repeat protein